MRNRTKPAKRPFTSTMYTAAVMPRGTAIADAISTMMRVPTIACATPPNWRGSLDGVVRMSSVR
ncbi:MAG: hypothetical protein EBT97_01735 [Actinobacteria bacterium]|nr:hypothetical protein [Actinomycetota bacterium]